MRNEESMVSCPNIGAGNCPDQRVCVPAQVIDASIGQNFIFNTSVGREFVVALVANPSTGYDWRKDYDEAVVKLVSQEFKADEKATGVVGAGGTQRYRFKALKTGTTTLTFSYERSWEQKTVDETMIAVEIE
jgi:predicted secreted protein